ncbi:protein translocase subunit SecF [Prochlorococcus marinus]|uniref:Protein-export membrane protein SecF n=1 Tax=Prochlorococcus marinus (strain MIT 9211) TaxID=93059 RepID=A9B9Y6_PROM4|nr:protein translocase subunit SecF [Prochlorococcus marinus]ABX08648.1 preprotein translocase subunit [Prochlorococcus marinus str. MIT 9211]
MSSSPVHKTKLIFPVTRHRYKIWLVSGLAVIISIAGLISCWLNPLIGYPLRPGLDFTGGTQIKLERQCNDECNPIRTSNVTELLREIPLNTSGNESSPNLSIARVQFLDGYKSILVRLPFLTASQAEKVAQALDPIAGPFQPGGQSIDTIGPTLGAQLLKSSLISLLVAFSGIAVYISYRFDKTFALLALVALSHDVLIVCGVFAWLGIFLNLEVNSLFAVALLTISGYSVNDTVVVFDRIREINSSANSLGFNQKIDFAVSATLSRTLYTSLTTLLPLGALIFFGGDTLFWFSVALALGVTVGSWSSIALAPSLLSLRSEV